MIMTYLNPSFSGTTFDPLGQSKGPAPPLEARNDDTWVDLRLPKRHIIINSTLGTASYIDDGYLIHTYISIATFKHKSVLRYTHDGKEFWCATSIHGDGGWWRFMKQRPVPFQNKRGVCMSFTVVCSPLALLGIVLFCALFGPPIFCCG